MSTPMPTSRRDPAGGGALLKPNAKLIHVVIKALIMTLVTFLIFLFIGLASFLVLPIGLYSLHRQNQNRRCLISSNRLCTTRVKRLPQFKFSNKTDTLFGNDCGVCLDGFKQGQWCRRLMVCGHIFHKKCVDPWLIKAGACPICRTVVPLEDDKQDFWASFGRNSIGSGHRVS